MSTMRRLTALLATLAIAASALAYTEDIVLVNGGGLSFGQVVAGPSSGSVTVEPSGARWSAGGVVLGNPGGARAAEFTVTGDANAAYSVLLPSSASLDGASASMSVDAFTHDAGGVLVGGTETFRVGATLQVGASQASGAYSGTFVVTVMYE